MIVHGQQLHHATCCDRLLLLGQPCPAHSPKPPDRGAKIRFDGGRYYVGIDYGFPESFVTALLNESINGVINGVIKNFGGES